MLNKLVNNAKVSARNIGRVIAKEATNFARDARRAYTANFYWKTVLDDGKRVYEENTLTGERRAWQRWGGYQPYNTDWLNYRTDEL